MLITPLGSFDVIGLVLGLAWPVVAVTATYYAHRAFRCLMTSRKPSPPTTSSDVKPPEQAVGSKTPVDMRRMLWWGTFCGVNAAVLAISAERKSGLSLAYRLLVLFPLLVSLILSGLKFYTWTHYDKNLPGLDEKWIGGIALLLFLIGLIALRIT